MSEEKKYTFYVKGMHCKACVFLIEDRLKDAQGVTSVKADLGNMNVQISGNLGDDAERIAVELTPLIQANGYTLLTKKDTDKKNWSDFFYALPLALLFIFLFFLLQKAGLTNLISSSSVTYGTAFVVGLVASVSTCLAVVGGLVLSMSANYAKEGGRTKSQLLFHSGRLIGFFFLGGLIGAIGSAFHLGSTSGLVLSLVVGVVMLFLGINLLDVFDFSKRLQFSLPQFFARKTVGQATSITHTFAPFLVGATTFFLPCGFTQSMQVYTLTTGSFIKGGLTMLLFALGTLPVLSLLSFGSFGVAQKSWKGIFFKTAGLIVIILALFNLINALVVAGLISPVFNF
jgi:sulfite exporter TauE/SafE/copper chaperone CopZ